MDESGRGAMASARHVQAFALAGLSRDATLCIHFRFRVLGDCEHATRLRRGTPTVPRIDLLRVRRLARLVPTSLRTHIRFESYDVPFSTPSSALRERV